MALPWLLVVTALAGDVTAAPAPAPSAAPSPVAVRLGLPPPRIGLRPAGPLPAPPGATLGLEPAALTLPPLGRKILDPRYDLDPMKYATLVEGYTGPARTPWEAGMMGAWVILTMFAKDSADPLLIQR